MAARRPAAQRRAAPRANKSSSVPTDHAESHAGSSHGSHSAAAIHAPSATATPTPRTAPGRQTVSLRTLLSVSLLSVRNANRRPHTA
eukprot:5814620-Prymnesium_polylepis.3